MIGKALNHYQVLEKLGAGGMGEVYRARDTRLGRDVGIKVLPVAFTDDPDCQRFLMVRPEQADAGPPQMHVVVDWFEELKRRAPVGKN